jgi:hypothetical protein
MTDRELLSKMWNETWANDTWYAAWNKTFAGLTVQQAAWKPDPKRHSIWQILNHIAFWRETVVNRLAGKPPTDEECTRRNFETPSDVNDAAWRDAQARFERSHQMIAHVIADEKLPVEKVQYLLPHDAYHLGQIMYLRALQGLPAVS